MPKAGLEEKIDELYRLSPEEFTSARNALAKSLDARDAERVKSLAKPTLAAWAVNQLYWKDRPAYEGLVRSVEALRGAHEKIMGGGKADLAELIASRRSAIRSAESFVRETILGAGHPLTDATRDAIAQTLEGLPAEGPPGRLTGTLGPRGFDVFADTTAASRGAPGPGAAAKAAAGTGPAPKAASGTAGSRKMFRSSSAPSAAKAGVERDRSERHRGGAASRRSPHVHGAERARGRPEPEEERPRPGETHSASVDRAAAKSREAQRRAVDAAIARRLKAAQVEARRASAAAERAVFAAKRGADTARREARESQREMERLRARASRMREELETCEAQGKKAQGVAAEKEQLSASAESNLAKALSDLDAAKRREREANDAAKKS